jgi:hypothetical protein
MTSSQKTIKKLQTKLLLNPQETLKKPSKNHQKTVKKPLKNSQKTRKIKKAYKNPSKI